MDPSQSYTDPSQGYADQGYGDQTQGYAYQGYDDQSYYAEQPAAESVYADIAVQPVVKVMAGMALPPVVVHADVFTENYSGVFATIVVLDADKQPIAEQNQAQPLLITASPAVGASPAYGLKPKSTSSSSSRRGGGSSSSSSSVPIVETPRLWFAFNDLAFGFTGTYYLQISISQVGGAGWTCVSQLVSRKIKVVNDQDPEEEPSDREYDILGRLRSHKKLQRALHIPQGY